MSFAAKRKIAQVLCLLLLPSLVCLVSGCAPPASGYDPGGNITVPGLNPNSASPRARVHRC